MLIVDFVYLSCICNISLSLNSFTYFVLKVVEGKGVVQVKAISYSSSCSDNWFLRTQCDTFFQFCLKKPQRYYFFFYFFLCIFTFSFALTFEVPNACILVTTRKDVRSWCLSFILVYFLFSFFLLWHILLFCFFCSSTLIFLSIPLLFVVGSNVSRELEARRFETRVVQNIFPVDLSPCKVG